ncbi:PQQ-dependent sugar dehydrogenase [Paraglaciecola aquimarina]|uniref:PQQ-dependent sugar dehydrogenase n=1 Tax=Paraglaciecola aquimarina TaxID=1235557 RepID=A0ABU3SY64_9ALTE|nr:PQQ-dependent sugar dehydrogenase [Paraglaciecola aquimarina]MDU0354936.1 PQQ-dependent sugar dehydrogenase [Paraglaciecola aquimarina]
MLRLNVDTANDVPYSIPKDNPFVNNAAALDEIWAYGIRNPWRFTFHQGALIVADVGQSKLEEVNIVEKGGNYGWKIMEGDTCFKDEKQSCDKSQFVAPKLTYPRKDGMSITGGKVYTQGSVKGLANRYVYADFILGNIWSVEYPSFQDNRLELASGLNVSAFALDAAGELYLADFANGKIIKIID